MECVMRNAAEKKLPFFILVCILAVPFYTYAASLKPIIHNTDYNHTKYAPKCDPDDTLKHFRAYTTCFDGDYDDNSDGTPDKWAIQHWVA